MELALTRMDFHPTCTIGELAIDGAWECFTLEDAVREGPKIPGATAIPAGRYRLQMTLSVRFKRVLPILLDVTGFTGIRIHAGNTDADTEGCILVGQQRGVDEIGSSRRALEALLPKLAAGLDAGECWITITNRRTP